MHHQSFLGVLIWLNLIGNGLKELKRLVYVALTRAKNSLYFFTERPSQVFIKALQKKPHDTSPIKNYNEWLYWLTEIMGEEFITSTWQAESRAVTGNDLETWRLGDSEKNQEFNHPLALGHSHTLTVTELETLNHCQKRFELKYLKNIRPLSPRRSPAQRDEGGSHSHPNLSPKERGNLFHEVLQYYEYQRDTNLDTVIDQALFNQHIIDPDNNIRSQCHMFINKLRQTPLFQKILFENIKSWEEIEFACQLQEFTLSGQIDKVVQIKEDDGSEKWMIVDYKTHHGLSESVMDRLAERFSFQMSCYALAISKRFGLNEIDTLILFTSGPAYRKLHHSKEDLEKFENKLNELYGNFTQKLTQSGFEFTDDRNFCQDCSYYRDNYCGVKSL